MKKPLFIVAVLAFFLVVLGAGMAQAKIDPEGVYAPGTVKTDSIRWRASGATLPGTIGVRVDTIIGALDDTSSSVFDLAGCVWASASYVFSEMGANGGTGAVGVLPQTGPDAAGNIWVTQSELASNAGAPAQLDTVTQMLIQPDSIVTGLLTGNFRTQTRPDYLRARAHRWVRFVIVNTNTTNDTTMVKGVITRVW